MKLMNRKTRKAIRKHVRKAISKHGPAIAAGLVGGIASTLAAMASTDDSDNNGHSRLGKLSDKVRQLTGHDDSHQRSNGKGKAARVTEPASDRTLDADKSLSAQ